MAAFGLSIDDVAEEDDILLWPDNWLAFQVFRAMGTQWRVAMGATGLDYNVLPMVMRAAGVRRRDRDEVFWMVRAMEEAALLQMADDAEANRND